MNTEPLQRLSYLTRQRGFAAATAVVLRGVTALGGQPNKRKATRDETAALDQRFAELLAEDWDNARNGVYPAELLFDTKSLREMLRALPVLMADLPNMLRRSRAGRHDELPADI